MQICVVNMVKSVQLKTVRVCLCTMMVEPVVGLKLWFLGHIWLSAFQCLPLMTRMRTPLSFHSFQKRHPMIHWKVGVRALETIVTLKLPDLSAVCSVVVMVLIMIHVQVMIFTVCLSAVCLLHDNCDTEIARFVRSIACYCYGFDYDPCAGDDFHCLSVCYMSSSHPPKREDVCFEANE